MWCQLCGAYTGKRVGKLNRPCEGLAAKTRPIERLTIGRHPATNAPVSTMPRRMVIRDIGHRSGWDGSGVPEDAMATYEDAGLKRDDEHPVCVSVAMHSIAAHTLPPFLVIDIDAEDDPLL